MNGSENEVYNLIYTTNLIYSEPIDLDEGLDAS